MTLARYFYDAYIGTVSVFFLLIRTHRFFGDGSYAIIGPYMAEVLPASVRASGTGLGYGVGNLGKIIGPLGLALIIGSSNYVGPKATLDAVFSALLFLAFWYAFGACAFWLLGIETEGRSIEEIDGAFASQLSASRALASVLPSRSGASLSGGSEAAWVGTAGFDTIGQPRRLPPASMRYGGQF